MAQQPKKMFHIEMIVDHSIAWDIASMADKKAIKFEMRPVRHGGEDEGGQLQAKPSGREFLTAFAASRGEFRVQEAIREGQAVGLSRASVYGTLSTLANEKYLRRIDPGTYALSGAAPRQASNREAAGGVRHTKPVTATILDIVRAKQNGNGEGVHIREIKKGLSEAGITINGTSPAITALMKKKQLKRTAPSHYRATEA
jgi:Fe2+ or Zn2+ uptake regulation protein